MAEQAVKLALEMCGGYAIDVHDEEMGFYKRPPLTSVSKLEAYANRLHKRHGAFDEVRFDCKHMASIRQRTTKGRAGKQREYEHIGYTRNIV